MRDRSRGVATGLAFAAALATPADRAPRSEPMDAPRVRALGVSGVERPASAAGVRVEREAILMGTRLVVRVEAPSRDAGSEAIERVFEAVAAAEDVLSTWRDDTELARVNHAPPGRATPVSARLFGWLSDAWSWSCQTAGAFDPVVGALVDAWDLRGEGREPDARERRAALSRAGRRCFELGGAGSHVTRRCPGAWIDSGGFGKGAGLGEAAATLRSAMAGWGGGSAVLDFGGQLLFVGEPPRGGGWPVAIAHPAERTRPLFRLVVVGGSLATSGQSERGVVIGGERRGHVIDPRTGEPVPAWGSVTVRADDPLAADALATALLVLGPERGLRWLAGRPDVEAVFL
ncbi:MAG: FAD:protein FMN transferase, partial [Gemmatimonadota bacterium]